MFDNTKQMPTIGTWCTWVLLEAANSTFATNSNSSCAYLNRNTKNSFTDCQNLFLSLSFVGCTWPRKSDSPQYFHSRLPRQPSSNLLEQHSEGRSRRFYEWNFFYALCSCTTFALSHSNRSASATAFKPKPTVVRSAFCSRHSLPLWKIHIRSESFNEICYSCRASFWRWITTLPPPQKAENVHVYTSHPFPLMKHFKSWKNSFGQLKWRSLKHLPNQSNSEIIKMNNHGEISHAYELLFRQSQWETIVKATLTGTFQGETRMIHRTFQ